MWPDMREILRDVAVLKGTAPDFGTEDLPEDPVALFTDWLLAAVQAGVDEPHAMTLSTVDERGRPSARVLILKDVDRDGWHFAVTASSRKGRELAANPVAALTFHWREQARQVRVSGSVSADAPAVAAADFLARPLGSRLMALTRRQSDVCTGRGELDDALADARRELDADPDVVPSEWMSYVVRADEVEFWQGDPQRRHTRVQYTLAGGVWTQNLLWP